MYAPSFYHLSDQCAESLSLQVSGVPPLEKSGNKKFADDPKWKEYTDKVPVFWPVIGSTKFHG